MKYYLNVYLMAITMIILCNMLFKECTACSKQIYAAFHGCEKAIDCYNIAFGNYDETKSKGFPKFYLSYLYAKVNISKIESPAQFCFNLTNEIAYGHDFFKTNCMKIMAIAGFTQKFGVQAYEYALFNNLNAVFNEEQILKVTHSIAGYKTFEEWRTGGNYMVRYIKKMKTQANIDDLENASSVREWCLDGLELTCKCNLYADFGDGCESGGKCAEYAFKNLITTEIRDISEKYMKYLFDSIKEALPPLNLPVTFCKLKANFLFSNSRMKNNTYITAIINECVEDIKAEGFSETNIEQNKEFAFFHKREKSLALPSFVWSYIFEGLFDFDFQSVKADKPEEWCDRVLPKLAPKPNGQKLEELEESESNESDYELEVLTLGKPVEHPSY